MSIESDLFKVAMEEAKRERQSRGPTKEFHVVIADTMAEAKSKMSNHHCSRCWQEIRYYTAGNKNALRGQCFDDVTAIHVYTFDLIIWRDLAMCLEFSKFSGPIWVKARKRE